MSQVFISHVEEDESLAQQAADYLETQGYRAWLYERDSLPGVSYLIQTGQAIEKAHAVILIVSPIALGSYQITKEIVRAHEVGKPFIPILVNVSHRELQIRQPEWREALGAASSIRITPDAFSTSLPRILAGLQFLGVLPEERATIRETASIRTEPPDICINVDREPPSFDEVVTHPQLLVDLQIGPYHVRNPIGKGGSGIVYNVRSTVLGRRFALKLFYPIRPDLAPGISAIIASGVHALASLQHPNIIRIHDLSKYSLHGVDSYYIVMDLIVGKSLDEWNINLVGEDTLGIRTQLAYRVASALRAAHEAKYIDVVGWERTGVFHGDVKPGNILVTDSNQPMLADFGMIDVSRLLDPKVVPPSVLRRETVSRPLTAAFGTPGFMAPEQEQEGIVNAKTDVYGLGVTLWQMFSREVEKPESKNRMGDLIDLMNAMASRHAADRPRDMAEVVRLLMRGARSAGVKLPGSRAVSI